MRAAAPVSRYLAILVLCCTLTMHVNRWLVSLVPAAREGAWRLCGAICQGHQELRPARADARSVPGWCPQPDRRAVGSGVCLPKAESSSTMSAGQLALIHLPERDEVFYRVERPHPRIGGLPRPSHQAR